MTEILSDVIFKTSDESFESKLIRAVKLHKSLYCADDPNHFNVIKNRERWSKVAAICKKTVTECRSRWHSLLRTYYLSPPNSTWIHIEAFRNLGSNLSDNVIRNPTNNQKDELLKELLLHCSILLSPETTTKTCQHIWMEIVAKCNNMPGAILTRTKWQEYWFSLKQNVALNWSNLELRLRKDGDENKILNICGTSKFDTVSNIASAIKSNTELTDDWQNPTTKCKNCFLLRNELLFNGNCLECSKQVPQCCKCRTAVAVHKYKVNDWSQKAINMLQFEVTSNEISLCSPCVNKINRIATINWKSCRICATPQTKCDYLYHKSHTNLRDVLKDATHISLSEFDGLPGYICVACKTQIIGFNKFYQQFKQTQIQLKYLHDNHFINDKFLNDKLPLFIDNTNFQTLLPDKKLPNDYSANKPPVTEPSVAPGIIPEFSFNFGKPIKSSMSNLENREGVKRKPILPESIDFNFKPSLGVIPLAVLQLPNEDQQIVWNNNVTLQKRTSVTQTTAEAPVSIESNSNVEFTEKLSGLQILSNPEKSYTKSLNKLMPQNGDMLDKMPRSDFKASGAVILRNDRVDKIPQASKESLGTTLKTTQQKPKATIDISSKQEKSPKQLLLNPQAKVAAITVEQAKLILHQQQEIKRNRKSTETLARPLSMPRIQQSNDTQCFHSKVQNTDTTLEEIADYDYDNDIFIKSDPVLSYPDSFQLNCEPIEPDDKSSTFTEIMTIIHDNSFEQHFLNTSIPIRCLGKRKKDVQGEKEEKKNDGGNKKRIMQPFAKLKKIRIKIKRNKKIQMFLSKQHS